MPAARAGIILPKIVLVHSQRSLLNHNSREWTALDCTTDMPGLISNMIHVETIIEGVRVTAFVDTRAAANVCTRKVAYQIYINGEAVFREWASCLLSLTAFGGNKVKLLETFFAAWVTTEGKTFDQLFFIVDSDQHDVLLGLPAIMSQECIW